jgi:hypothetical protein
MRKEFAEWNPDEQENFTKSPCPCPWTSSQAIIDSGARNKVCDNACQKDPGSGGSVIRTSLWRLLSAKGADEVLCKPLDRRLYSLL